MAEFCVSFLQAYLDCDNNNAFILIELDSDINNLEDIWSQKLYALTIIVVQLSRQKSKTFIMN